MAENSDKIWNELQDLVHILAPSLECPEELNEDGWSNLKLWVFMCHEETNEQETSLHHCVLTVMATHQQSAERRSKWTESKADSEEGLEVVSRCWSMTRSSWGFAKLSADSNHWRFLWVNMDSWAQNES